MRRQRTRPALAAVLVAAWIGASAAAQEPTPADPGRPPVLPQPPSPPAPGPLNPQVPAAAATAEIDPDVLQRARELTRQLDSDSFQLREQATLDLQELGPAAVAAIGEAMPKASAEVAIRGVYVLGVISTSGDPDVQAAARDALDEIVSFDSVAAAYARDTLGALESSMRRRAIEELRQLGAKLQTDQFEGAGGNVRRQVTEVKLDEDWTGQDKDLRWLRMLSGVTKVTFEGEKVNSAWFRNLPRNRDLQQLVVKNAALDAEAIDQVTEIDSLVWLEIKYCTIGDREALKLIVMNRLEQLRVMDGQISERIQEQLKLALPNANVDIRRGAFLGVSCVAHPLGVEITRVEPGTAADQNGFRVRDVIVTFNEENVQSFEDLTSLISNYKSGRKVPIVAVRNAVVSGTQIAVPADKKWLLEGKPHLLGMEVVSVGDGGLGDAAGLQKGDVLATVNGERVEKPEELPAEGVASMEFVRRPPEIIRRDVELGRDFRD